MLNVDVGGIANSLNQIKLYGRMKPNISETGCNGSYGLCGTAAYTEMSYEIRD